MDKNILKKIEKSLDLVDATHDNDWVILGEKLMDTILNNPEYDGTFTELQKHAIIAVCRETYHAASITARAYVYTAISTVINEIDQ